MVNAKHPKKSLQQMQINVGKMESKITTSPTQSYHKPKQQTPPSTNKFGSTKTHQEQRIF